MQPAPVGSFRPTVVALVPLRMDKEVALARCSAAASVLPTAVVRMQGAYRPEPRSAAVVQVAAPALAAADPNQAVAWPRVVAGHIPVAHKLAAAPEAHPIAQGSRKAQRRQQALGRFAQQD